MNEDFEIYLKKYCAQNKISRTEALKHALVKEVAKLYNVKESEVPKCIQESH